MSDFKFVNSERLNFNITDVDDNVIKDYSFNFADGDFLKRVKEADKVFKDNVDKINDLDVDATLESMKAIIDGILGVNEFEFLYSKFDKNVAAMVELVRAIFDKINTKRVDRFEKYK